MKHFLLARSIKSVGGYMKKRIKKYKLKLPVELKEALSASSRNWHLFKALTEEQQQECVAFIVAGTSKMKRIYRAQRVMAILNGQGQLLKFYPC